MLFTDQPPVNTADLTGRRGSSSGRTVRPAQRAAAPSDTVVTNASGVQDRPIAEWVVMMLLALGRRFPEMLAAQREHRWDRSSSYQAELRGMRVGILGYGNIGREVARLLQPLGMRVSVHDPDPQPGPRRPVRPAGHAPDAVPEPERWFTFEDRDAFYSGIEALVVAVPDSAGTRGLVDAARPREIPRGALLLNPARARVVDE